MVVEESPTGRQGAQQPAVTAASGGCGARCSCWPFVWGGRTTSCCWLLLRGKEGAGCAGGGCAGGGLLAAQRRVIEERSVREEGERYGFCLLEKWSDGYEYTLS